MEIEVKYGSYAKKVKDSRVKMLKREKLEWRQVIRRK